ncbi:purine-nucleoside phosphorylase [Eubacterium ruminantium]|jgi:purine-nucleoside phosphorylase|uniref:Purine nucleoside phosphorylase n=1 Tax=Eubacterium ruminantium TaxID=42322 RepID=A0A1T4PEV4_9FIRM|nr:MULTISPECIES: purine-nucleoside phosphorylase [Eubacterium]MCR5368829.1 purine-nucleoside phosphorylase [Eubacterium sp.]SCW58005.1 purine-nucleoside phosphorylase [Eubacterium ruminantium]SDN00404.1 purine-nucleoside phosphorylase [Eubacterium ruminantium]SJZ89338.1 purine-nucleoside phosphorylase [Eubacterium ruminantium]
MGDTEKGLNDICNILNEKLSGRKPEIGIVLGSGLGSFAEKLENSIYINYQDIPGFPVSTVSGHNGRFVVGKLFGHEVIVMQGRVHYYEGYSMKKVVLPVRLMCMIGIKQLILTNAAGGINLNFKPGTLMAITDQITTFVPSPLIGPNIKDLGVRFPDMSEVYDSAFVGIIEKAAEELGIDLKKGIYLQTTGPQYETPAEIRMFRNLGADAVGMSTTVEAVAARHAGVKVAGISCITNMAAGISGEPLSHEEVKETADRVKDEFEKLLLLSVKKYFE